VGITTTLKELTTRDSLIQNSLALEREPVGMSATKLDDADKASIKNILALFNAFRKVKATDALAARVHVSACGVE
jgi:hypothetical protein